MASDVRTIIARLAPLVLGLMAVAAFAIGILQQMQINARHAALAQVYLAGPPPAVSLDRFDTRRDIGPLGEARVTALLDLDAARNLPPLAKGGPTALAIPLRDGTGTASGLAIFVMDDPARITPETLRAVAGVAPAEAPLLTLNGMIRSTGPWQGALSAAGLATGGPVIFPFVEGRRAAILPPDYGQPTAVRHYSWIGGLLSALALVAFAARLRGNRRRDRIAADGEAGVATSAPPTRAILLGLALAFVAAASFLAMPGLTARFGFAAPVAPGLGIETWAAERWEAALSGDLRAILILVLASGAVVAVALKVAFDTVRRPAATS